MARLTNVERAAARALDEARRADEEKVRLAEMPKTLLKLMARAEDCGLSTRIGLNANGDIMVRFTDQYGDDTVILLNSPEHLVRSVEVSIEHKEYEVEEQRALEARKAAARAKLTHDDLVALGLA